MITSRKPQLFNAATAAATALALWHRRLNKAAQAPTNQEHQNPKSTITATAPQDHHATKSTPLRKKP